MENKVKKEILSKELGLVIGTDCGCYKIIGDINNILGKLIGIRLSKKYLLIK